MIKYEHITKFYLKNKNSHAIDLWSELCQEYCRRAETRFYKPKYKLAEFARQFCSTELEAKTEIDKKNQIHVAMSKVNQRLLTIQMEQAGAFVNVLQFFLNCYPSYLSEFHESIVTKLFVKPYCLPITEEQITDILTISERLRRDHEYDSSTIRSLDLLNEMSEKILEPERNDYFGLSSNMLSSIPKLTNLPLSDKFVLQMIKKIKFADKKECYNSDLAIDFFEAWSAKISDQHKEALLNYIIHVPKTQRLLCPKSIVKRIDLLERLSDFFCDTSKAKVVGFLKKYLTSSEASTVIRVLECGIGYASTIQELQLENDFRQLSLKILKSNAFATSAIGTASYLLQKLNPNILSEDSEGVIECLVSKLLDSSGSLRNKIYFELTKFSSDITGQYADQIMDYSIQKLKEGCDDFCAEKYYPMVSYGGDVSYRFDLIEKISAHISHAKKNELADVFIAELTRPEELFPSDTAMKKANERQGGLLFNLLKYHYLIPDAKKEVIQNALLHHLQDMTHRTYISFIGQILVQLGLLKSQEYVDKAMHVLLLSAKQHLRRESGWHSLLQAIGMMNTWFEFASTTTQLAILGDYPNWFLGSSRSFEFSELLLRSKHITAVYIRNNEAEVGTSDETFMSPANEKFDSIPLDDIFQLVDELGVANEIHPHIISQLNNPCRVAVTLRELIKKSDKLSASNKKLLINTVIKKLPFADFIESISQPSFGSFDRADIYKLQSLSDDPELEKIKKILIGHLRSNIPNVFTYTCFQIFKMLPEFQREINEIYDILFAKLNDEDKNIRRSACVLMTHILDHLSRSQRNNLLVPILKNINQKDDEDEEQHLKIRARNIMFSILTYIAVDGFDDIREVIVKELFVRLMNESERDIARSCLIYLIQFLSDDQANQLVFGLIPNRLTEVKQYPHSLATDIYAFDLYSIMIEGVERRRERYEKLKLFSMHFDTEVSKIIADYHTICAPDSLFDFSPSP